MTTDDTKRCSKCGAVKPRSEFGSNSSKPDGLRYSCRACERVRDAGRRQRPERKAQQRAYRQRRGPLPPAQRRAYAQRYLARNHARNAAGAPPPPEKRCPRCDAMKPASDFSRNRAMGDGLDVYCRACRRAYVQARTAARREVGA